MDEKSKEKPENQRIFWMIKVSYIENEKVGILVILGIMDQGVL
jgi:hypothetical protein